MLIATEHSLRLAYYLEEGRLVPEWANTAIRPRAMNDADDLCAVIQAASPYAHMFGPPNDEAFSGHPLAARGLSPYAVFEVERSSWIRSLEHMNSVHPHHRPERFATLKHYIFAFHDTTFECVAESFSVSLASGSVWRILQVVQNEG